MMKKRLCVTIRHEIWGQQELYVTIRHVVQGQQGVSLRIRQLIWFNWDFLLQNDTLYDVKMTVCYNKTRCIGQ